MKSLRERVAVVTGAVSGIGRGLAKRLASEGMHLVAADVDEQGLASLATELEAEGASVASVPTDVSRADEVERLAEETLRRFGAVHLVCNNAGVVSMGRLWETSEEDWRRVLDVNLWGVVHGIRTFVPILLRQGVEGHIVNTSSITGLIGGKGIGPYRTSKHAVVALSETLYHELQGVSAEVRVSVLCPGFVRTAIFDNAHGAFAEDEESSLLRQDLKHAVETGASPDAIADHVVRGVLENRFYLLPHPGYGAEIQGRVQNILDGRAPTLL